MSTTAIGEDFTVPFERTREDQAWARWIARLADGLMLTPFVVLVFFVLGGLVEIGRAPPELLTLMENQVGSVAMEIAATFVLFALWEPLFLSNAGTTPGKWLMGMRVLRNDGSRLSFLRALNRLVRVWFLGMGSQIPLLALILMLVSRAKLTADGVTAWDESLDCKVEHRKRHPAVWAAVITATLALNFGLAILFRLAENM